MQGNNQKRTSRMSVEEDKEQVLEESRIQVKVRKRKKAS
jgi:hypothetical protein